MSRRWRGQERNPRLTMPALVRLIAGPAPPHPGRELRSIWPVWVVRAMVRLGHHVALGPSAETVESIGGRLAVLVVPPAWCVDLVAGYQLGPEWVRCPSAWGPVCEVPPERHDPSKGHFCPDLCGALHFEEEPNARQ